MGILLNILFILIMNFQYWLLMYIGYSPIGPANDQDCEHIFSLNVESNLQVNLILLGIPSFFHVLPHPYVSNLPNQLAASQRIGLVAFFGLVIFLVRSSGWKKILNFSNIIFNRINFVID